MNSEDKLIERLRTHPAFGLSLDESKVNRRLLDDAADELSRRASRIEELEKALGATPVATYIADEEDGGAVGVVLDLPNGDQVWCGEVSRDLFDEQDADVQEEMVNDYGNFIIHAANGKPTRILARAADRWAAMDIATAYAEWVARQALSDHPDKEGGK